MKIRWKFTLALLSLVLAVIWTGILAYPDQNLHIIACDVGQGDAILATYGSTQILIDGGPNNKVLDCLSDNMAFWDRKIEAVVNTHPQTDHYQGLIEVFERYDVDIFIANALDSSSQSYQVLKSLVGGKGIEVHNPQSGQSIRLGLIYLDILWPSEEFIESNFSPNNVAMKQSSNVSVLGSFTSKRDPNDFSVVVILQFGDFDALLTGDLSPEVSDEISKQIAVSNNQSIEYLKVPHHGSKNGLTKNLLEAAGPEVAVISAGKDNRYGHPHKEVIDLLNKQNIKILRTDEIGDVEVISDGTKFWIE